MKIKENLKNFGYWLYPYFVSMKYIIIICICMICLLTGVDFINQPSTLSVVFGYCLIAISFISAFKLIIHSEKEKVEKKDETKGN